MDSSKMAERGAFTGGESHLVSQVEKACPVTLSQPPSPPALELAQWAQQTPGLYRRDGSDMQLSNVDFLSSGKKKKMQY